MSRLLVQIVMAAVAVGIGAGAASASDVDGKAADQERSTRYYLGFITAGSWVTADPTGTNVTPGTDTDDSFFWGANLGVEMPVFRDTFDLRLELEGTNERKFHFDTPGGTNGYSSDIQAWTFQGNFWLVYPLKKLWPDMPVINRISPFGGGGVGLSRNTFDTVNGSVSGSDRSVTFAWQGGVGVSFDVVRWLTLDLRYQYIDLGKQSVSLQDGGSPAGNLEYDLGGNEIVGGLRFVY
jgi:opacity protein-like surface antigen